MCFLKHLRFDNSASEGLHFQQSTSKFEFDQSSHEDSSKEILNNSIPTISIPYYKNFSNSTEPFAVELQSLCQMIQSNNQLISHIQNKICSQNWMPFQDQIYLPQVSVLQDQENSIENEDGLVLSREKLDLKVLSSLPSFIEDEAQKNGKDEMLQKLFCDFGHNFGGNGFKYKISLENSFPSKVFKNRKFGLKFKLVPCAARGTKIVQNSNILNVFIAVFDKDGNWVHENTIREPIMNGESQSFFFQGKGQFSRILINEISSNMEKEKLNLAVYVVPTTDFALSRNLVCSNENSHGNFVDWKSIKPLIIRNVSVLSKKTKSNREDID